MILSEHTVICDSCGLQGPSSEKTRLDAQLRAQADGWTCDDRPNLALASKHWCHDCTRTRQETDRG